MARFDNLAADSNASDAGFSLVEALVALVLTLVVFTTAMDGLNRTIGTSRVVGNRTEMHSSVRAATELMQQEIGQAGRVAMPGPITLTGAAAIGVSTVAVDSTAGLFPGAKVVVGAGPVMETVTLTAIGAGTITGSFEFAHAAGEAVDLRGGFASGVVPPAMANGSTGTVLKFYGDIDDDGSMRYIEYVCDVQAGRLYRNVMAWDAAAKPALTLDMVLLNNVIANPGGAPCFTYQTETVGPTIFVTGVAVTLSVRSQQVDQQTGQFLQATKTLLNVSPRNVFLLWTMASIGVTNRMQPMPPSVQVLLP